jgi:predicted transcriptional regulator
MRNNINTIKKFLRGDQEFDEIDAHRAAQSLGLKGRDLKIVQYAIDMFGDDVARAEALKVLSSLKEAVSITPAQLRQIIREEIHVASSARGSITANDVEMSYYHLTDELGTWPTVSDIVEDLGTDEGTVRRIISSIGIFDISEESGEVMGPEPRSWNNESKKASKKSLTEAITALTDEEKAEWSRGNYGFISIDDDSKTKKINRGSRR